MISLASHIESTLLPLPITMEWNEGNLQTIPMTTLQKIKTYACKAFSLLGSIVALPVVIVYSMLCYSVSLFLGKTEPKKEALALPGNGSPLRAIEHFGFADSLFQSSGIGSKASATLLEGKSNWDAWLHSDAIETKEGIPEIFIDMLKNPKPLIHILKNEMHATAHRFSLEWSVIEPEKGRYNQEAISLYRNFITELKAAGIEPYVTLHHFTSPAWFGNAGDFASLEQVDLFVDYALKMIELFPEVTNWMTFNEPGVYTMQSRLFGSYPPGKKGCFEEAGLVMRNVLIAHCKIYAAAKEKWKDRVSIGITHQWLRFIPLNGTGNVLENLICYYFSKVTHYCVYNFFKTGHFAFEFPYSANVHFEIPEKEFLGHNRFLDFIGVQFYAYPRVKAGWNGGMQYPGYKVWNMPGISVGSTCPEGGKAMSMGLSFYPESLEHCLEEASQLQRPIAITEIGCDARVQHWNSSNWVVDEETQKQYFMQIVPILRRFQNKMKAFFVWTLYRDQLEWDRGTFPKIGVIKLKKGKENGINGYEILPAAQFIQGLFQNAKEEANLSAAGL